MHPIAIGNQRAAVTLRGTGSAAASVFWLPKVIVPKQILLLFMLLFGSIVYFILAIN